MPAQPDDVDPVTTYLTELIRWLSFTEWPVSQSITRQLRVADAQARTVEDAEDLDADDLARHSKWLLVLGEPGSGKSWLARRTATLHAQAALTALTLGAPPDRVELPVYTTCSLLSSAAGDTRQAAVSSMLAQLPGLHSPGVAAAVRARLARPRTRMLLIIDAINEVSRPDHRLDQAATLLWDCRVMLTSRPTAWRHQIEIPEGREDAWVTMLQPLRYPDHVESFIANWFRQQPEQGNRLAVQLAQRPALRPAARVPLLLSFYCILGGDQPLPVRARDLRAQVVQRMLGNGSDVAAMQDLAWSGATEDATSGVRSWPDEVPGLSYAHRSIREHLVAEHVAMRMGADEAAGELLKHMWYDPDWEYSGPVALAMHPERDEVLRSIARLMPSRDLALADGDTVFPRFLARLAAESDENDWLPDSARMIGRARWNAGKLQSPEWIPSLTAGWPTSDGLLLRALIRELTNESDPWIAAAQVDAMTRLNASEQDVAAGRVVIVGVLSRERRPWMARILAKALAGLGPTEDDSTVAREALIALLFVPGIRSGAALEIADAAAGLNPSAQDRMRIRSVLAGLLAGSLKSRMSCALAETMVALGADGQEMADARSILLGQLSRETEPRIAQDLAKGLAALGASGQEMADARSMLLEKLSREAIPASARLFARVVVRLGATGEDLAAARALLLRMLSAGSNPRAARELAQAIAELEPTERDLADARSALLGLLSGETDLRTARELAGLIAALDSAGRDRAMAWEMVLQLLASHEYSWTARELTATVRLAETPQERAQAFAALLAKLSGQPSWVAADLADVVAEAASELDLAEEDRIAAREALLQLLVSQESSWVARGLGRAVSGLAVTAWDRGQVREALLGQLSRLDDLLLAVALAESVGRLDPTEDDRARAWARLLGLAARSPGVISGTSTTQILARAVTEFDPAERDRARIRVVLLDRLSHAIDPWDAISLAEAVARLERGGDDTSHALDALVRLLSRYADLQAGNLINTATWLAVTDQEKAKIAKTVLKLMSQVTNAGTMTMLTQGLAGLGPAEQELARARKMLLKQLTLETFVGNAAMLAIAMATLDPLEEDLALARDVLVRMLAQQTRAESARQLMQALAVLRPALDDLADWRSWATPPDSRLLATVRRNSPLAAWLASMPSLIRHPQATGE